MGTMSLTVCTAMMALLIRNIAGQSENEVYSTISMYTYIVRIVCTAVVVCRFASMLTAQTLLALF